MIYLICTLEPTRIQWLPQLVQHYRTLGVDRFLFSLQQEPTVNRLMRERAFERFAEQLRVLECEHAFSLNATFDVWALREQHARLHAQFVSAEDWVVWCDSDEFQVYPCGLKSLTTECESKGIELLRGVFIDRIAADYSLPQFDPAMSVWAQFPLCCNVSALLAKAETRKVVLCRGHIQLDVGHHRPFSGGSYTSARGWVQIHHFKWHAGVIQTLRFRIQPAWRDKCNWWMESKRLLDYFEANGGRFSLADLQMIPLNGAQLMEIAENAVEIYR
ncbi:MAG: glycosyltransferase family 2 protein [Burkholderiales bacterium]|nr:glycosyltransferase family 2 protein [Burkholderiales bacterium]